MKVSIFFETSIPSYTRSRQASG